MTRTARPTFNLDDVPAQYRSRRGHVESEAVRAADARINIGKALGGYSLGSALAVMAKDSVFYTPEELLAWLRPGITVRVRCAAHARGTWKSHKVRINPDGTIDALDHPDDVYLEGEFLLAALANFMPACLMVSHVVPQHLSTPGFYSAGRQSLDSRFRPLYAAVMWAQVPDADWTMIADLDLLRLHVTPDVMAAWHEAGFSTEQALPFWKSGAGLAQSRPWLAAGKTDARAARLAKDGQVPDSDVAWAQAGFSPSAAQPWRRITDLSPTDAYEWHRRGFTVTAYKNLHNPRRWGPRTRLDQPTAFAWAEAGLRGADVEEWYRCTGGDLDTALYWQPTGIRPGHLITLIAPNNPPAWNGSTGMFATPVPGPGGATRQELFEWRDAGFPMSEGDMLRNLRQRGMTPRWWALEVKAAGGERMTRNSAYTLACRVLNITRL